MLFFIISLDFSGSIHTSKETTEEREGLDMDLTLVAAVIAAAAAAYGFALKGAKSR